MVTVAAPVSRAVAGVPAAAGRCGTCGGSGSNMVQCQACDGRANCNACDNTRVVTITCTACGGTGRG